MRFDPTLMSAAAQADEQSPLEIALKRARQIGDVFAMPAEARKRQAVLDQMKANLRNQQLHNQVYSKMGLSNALADLNQKNANTQGRRATTAEQVARTDFAKKYPSTRFNIPNINVATYLNTMSQGQSNPSALQRTPGNPQNRTSSGVSSLAPQSPTSRQAPSPGQRYLNSIIQAKNADGQLKQQELAAQRRKNSTYGQMDPDSQKLFSGRVRALKIPEEAKDNIIREMNTTNKPPNQILKENGADPNTFDSVIPNTGPTKGSQERAAKIRGGSAVRNAFTTISKVNSSLVGFNPLTRTYTGNDYKRTGNSVEDARNYGLSRHDFSGFISSTKNNPQMIKRFNKARQQFSKIVALGAMTHKQKMSFAQLLSEYSGSSARLVQEMSKNSALLGKGFANHWSSLSPQMQAAAMAYFTDTYAEASRRHALTLNGSNKYITRTPKTIAEMRKVMHHSAYVNFYKPYMEGKIK